MEGPLKERDWKYMRSIHDEMLHRLSTKINRRASEIATPGPGNPHKQYLALYRHIKDSDSIIEDCFNDWSRSRLSSKIIHLRHHGLLRDQHVKNLSAEAQEWLRNIEEMEKKTTEAS
jgi:hypothetical protein